MLFFFQNEYIAFYKHSDRRTFSLALVNSCMFVRLSDIGAVECLRMSFGGIGRKVIVTEKIMPKNEGR